MSNVRAPGKFQVRVSGFARRVSRRTTLLGLIAAAFAGVLAFIAWSSVNGVPFQDRYVIYAEVPREAPILQPGDAVRIAGRLAGFVTKVGPYRKNTKIKMELRPAYAPVGEDAHLKVRVRSLVYLTYAEINPGDLEHPLPEGGTIPLKRSSSGVDLLEVTQLFDKQARDTLRQAIYNAGIGVAGRGKELNSAFADLPSVTRNGASEIEALTARRGAIATTVAALARITRGLRGVRPDDLAGVIVSGSKVVGVLAERRFDLGEAVDLLRPLEDEYLASANQIDDVLTQSGALSEELTPPIHALERALPDLNATLARGDEIRVQTERLAVYMNPILRVARPVIRKLRVTVASIDPLVRALDRFTGVMNRYTGDLNLAGKEVVNATKTRYPEGQTAPGNPALRFAPILTCHTARDPYPQPGETRSHSQAC